MTKPSKIAVKELGHIVLYVSNLQKSVDFYHHLLGWKQINTPNGVAVAAFSSGRTHHELLLIEVGERAPRTPRGLHIGLYHFGLKIGESDDDLRAAIVQLQAAGITDIGSADHTVTHSLYIADPDGNEIELYIDVPGVDWRTKPEAFNTPVKPLHL